MAYEGWATFAGVEIINNARIKAYAEGFGIAAIKCPPCPDLPAAVGDDPYTNPVTDDAPWYDPGVPESGRFAGFLGLEFVGLNKGTARRGRVDLAGGGSALTPAIHSDREFTVRTYAVAQDYDALVYGLGWLITALKGGICTPACGGDEFCLFSACPSGDPEALDFGDHQSRTMFEVGIVDPPTLGTVRKLSGGVGARIEYTLVAGKPWLYHEPGDITLNTDLDEIYEGDVIGGEDPDVVCVEPTDCLVDPFCPPPPTPPAVPIPVDPCFPTTPYIAERFIIAVPPDVAPEWLEKVPLISLYTGNEAMRRVSIRFLANVQGGDCLGPSDPCASCTEINVAYLPPGATLTLDGRVERATVDCAGGSGMATTQPALYGPGGTTFSWPVFDCNTSLCIEVLVEKDYRAANAMLSMQIVARTDAT